MSHEIKIDTFLIKIRKRNTKDYQNFSTIFNNDFLSDFFKSFNNRFQGEGESESELKIRPNPFTSKDMIDDKIDLASAFMQGGHSGLERNIFDSKNEDGKPKDKLTKDDIISMEHFCLIHTPKKHQIGVIIVQGYTIGSISSVLTKKFKKYFDENHPDFILDFERYIPNELRDDYIKNSVIKKIRMRKTRLHEDKSDELFGIKSSDFDVEISIKSSVKNLLEILNRSKGVYSLPIFEEMGNSKYSNLLIEYENNGKKTIAKLKDGIKIEPRMYIEFDDFPSLDQIKKACMDHFKIIKKKLSEN